MTKRIYALICARSGSKGLPGKNIRPLAGKPLIAHSVESAIECPQIDDVYVSTDSPEIAAVAKEYGAKIPFLRPPELAQDDSPEWLVWQHMLSYFRDNQGHPDALVVLPPTAPLRCLDDISGSINRFFDQDCDGVLCATPAHRSPEFNMVRINDTGACELAITSRQPKFRRQDSGLYYDVTTVCYVMKPAFVMAYSKLFDGRILMHEVPIERAVDIDTKLDFEWAEFLIKQRNNV